MVRGPDAGLVLGARTYILKITSQISCGPVDVHDLPMEGSLHDIQGSSDHIAPQEDPNRRKFSSQYSVSTHSVPVRRTHHITKTDNSRKHSQPGKHRRRRHHRHRRSDLTDQEESANPSDVVAEILGKTYQIKPYFIWQFDI